MRFVSMSGQLSPMNTGVDMTEKFMRALRSGDPPSFLHAINRAAAIAALCCVVIGGTSTTVTIAAAAAPAKAMKEIHEAASRPHVYLMRGLMNVFSLGMDQLAAAIAGHGIEASVSNHAEADAVVRQIAARYRAGDHGPIILVGHSLGADAVMLMAQSLSTTGIPVALVVPFDGTASYAASQNVACVLNVTQREFAYMHAGVGFHGKLANVDVRGAAGIDHFTIDKSPELQAYALKSVLAAASGQSCQLAVGGATATKLVKGGRSPHAAAPRLGAEGRVSVAAQSVQ
jgi:pimeloyl-ACP methyl ester carboxylesterase